MYGRPLYKRPYIFPKVPKRNRSQTTRCAIPCWYRWTTVNGVSAENVAGKIHLCTCGAFLSKSNLPYPPAMFRTPIFSRPHADTPSFFSQSKKSTVHGLRACTPRPRLQVLGDLFELMVVVAQPDVVVFDVEVWAVSPGVRQMVDGVVECRKTTVAERTWGPRIGFDPADSVRLNTKPKTKNFK